MINRMSRVAWLSVLLIGLTVAPLARAAELTLKDPDKEVQIKVPIDWERQTVPAGIRSVVMGNPTHDAFVHLTHIRKEDSTLKDLKACADVSFRNDFNNGRGQNSKVTGPKSITVNGHPAIQYEQTCNWADKRMTMVRTYIELDGSWNIIICGSRPSDANAMRPKFDRMIDSFNDTKDVPASTQPANDADLDPTHHA